MPGTLTDDVEIIETTRGGNGAGGQGVDHTGGGGDGGGGDDDFDDRALPAVPQRAYVTGITVGLAGILMFFMALTSAYIVRKGASNDWRAFVVPRVLWVNTLVLLASSFTIVRARRKLAQQDVQGFRDWWRLTTGLGLVFVIGQLLAWRQLADQGLYLASNPSSSFFYVFTAAHGLHLLGGILALLFIALRRPSKLTKGTATEVASIYWHFMDGLWVFLFLLFFLGR